jgi:hypothetical protein
LGVCENRNIVREHIAFVVRIVPDRWRDKTNLDAVAISVNDVIGVMTRVALMRATVLSDMPPNGVYRIGLILTVRTLPVIDVQ